MIILFGKKSAAPRRRRGTIGRAGADLDRQVATQETSTTVCLEMICEAKVRGQDT